MAAVLLTTTASGAELPEYSQSQEYSGERHGGAYVRDVLTGEVKYIPESDNCSDSVEDNEGYLEYTESEKLPQPRMVKNLVAVDDTTIMNYNRHTVHISISTASGKKYQGTGFLIAPNIVVTAAHVIYNEKYGGGYWASGAEITPAKQSDGTAPYGTAESSTLICSGDWISDPQPKNDWGVIVLNSNIGNRAGCFQLNPPALSYLWKEIELTGYIENTQYMADGSISASYSKVLESGNAYVEKGMSGGPCYIRSSTGVCLVIGINVDYLSQDSAGKFHTTTRFRKIDNSLYDKLISYCEEYAI